ncbi:MAG: cysteine--tRNA ligase [Chloroflexota bacterium]
MGGATRAMLRLYDTLTAAIRPFEPSGPVVTMYVCGVTPYDTTHLGHGFTFVFFDIVLRYIRYLGHTVRYVQNVTDVDDPLFEKSRELGIPYDELAAEETRRYVADMLALNVLPPNVYPHASREIPDMIRLVEGLIADGHAYVVDGYVYFSIATDATYGQLSKYERATMIETARLRGGDPDDPRRRDALDFVLWRPARSDEPRVPSPWGDGLPGWHIECSTMALKYLGPNVDIHGGGDDLIFPHHESEIAQSEAITGTRPFARYWLHTGMVYLGGEKMSKSLGNMVFVRDLIAAHGSNALRLYLSGHHYREQLQYDDAALADAAARAQGFERAMHVPGGFPPSHIDPTQYRDRFLERMDDNLDTPGAIAVLGDLANAIEVEGAQNRDVSGAQQTLDELGSLLGLRLRSAPR